MHKKVSFNILNLITVYYEVNKTLCTSLTTLQFHTYQKEKLKVELKLEKAGKWKVSTKALFQASNVEIALFNVEIVATKHGIMVWVNFWVSTV
jgi:hypothetical protein